MTIVESIILGAVQGVTEFLPVSSSGHLQIAKALLGVEIEENLAFDTTLHAATVLSTIVILWPEIKRLIVGLFSRHFNAEQAYVLKIALSMIPIGIVGFAFKDYFDMMLSSPYILTIVGAMLLLTAFLLAFAYYAHPRQKAAMPGLSRSGTTIATGLLLGNKKESMAQFSFLMVLAPILGEMLLNLVKGEVVFSSIGVVPMIAGFVSAFVVGCLACKFMIDIVKRGKLIWFAVYCAVVGVVSIVSNFL